MKILNMCIFSDPRTQGGIQTFGRTMKKFYPKELRSLTVVNSSKKIYKVSNLIEVGSNNFFFRIINKLLKNKLKEYLIKKEVKKCNWDAIIFSFPYELEILKYIKAKKIMVQHFNIEKFIKIAKSVPELPDLIKELNWFIVLSPYDKEKFQKKFDISEKKIRIIRHTCNIEIIRGKKEKNKKLIMIARIDNHQKRFDLAIRAMKKLSEFTLEIYGDGPDIEKCENIIKNESIKNVFLRGGTNKVQEKLDESGIFIMTSDFEGYGITNIEAMRRGLPLIVRNTYEAAQDIVIDNGVLLEKEWDEDKFIEAVREVYDNYEYYSENSKKLGERHSPEVIKKEWDKLLKENTK